ncbi:MAG: dihydrofolate reductase [Planctomycetota bacterium]
MTAVVAATPSGVIGRNGDIPWHLREDLRRFKKLTMGGALIMGRKTFDSIGRTLPGRKSIVVTRNTDWSFPEVSVASSPDAAVELAGDLPCFVVGGAEIYRQLLSKCDQLFYTRVFSSVEGDTHLELPLEQFRVVEQWRIPPGPRDEIASEFVRLIRKQPAQNS